MIGPVDGAWITPEETARRRVDSEVREEVAA